VRRGVSSVKLTPARRRGLHAIAAKHPEPARRSNETNVRLGYCYWQSADWLVEHGYATFHSWTYVALTEKGVQLARDQGLL
jgi:hypothetical protein